MTTLTIKAPIFIVGSSRSGTTLIARVLRKHSDVWIPTNETHYFDDLRQQMAGHEQQPLNSEDAKRCEDFFLSLTHKLSGSPYVAKCDPDQGWMNRQELRTLAESLGDGSDSYFEAFCELEAKRNNKTRWGEKTPRHVFRIPEILTRYPNAKIVCMVRHPAAVLASYRDFSKSKKNWSENPNVSLAEQQAEELRLKNSYNPMICSLMWRAALKAAFEGRRQFGSNRVFILRFEDLVSHPESTIKELTEWLSLDYQPSMIEVPIVNSSYSEKSNQRQVGLSQERAYRWREKLSNTEIALCQSLCSSLLSEAGYEREPVRVPPGLITLMWLTLPFVGLRALFANHDRITNIPDYILRRLRLAMGR